MRTTLLASTCLAAVLSTTAHAETSISTATTTPVRTSTVKSGAADDVKITSAGSVKPASGTAVTIDSNNKLTNDGTIQITNSDGATGIFANGGVSGAITNSATGKIIIDESYAPTDIDKDGMLAGPNFDQLAALRASVACKLIASGGVSSCNPASARGCGPARSPSNTACQSAGAG